MIMALALRHMMHNSSSVVENIYSLLAVVARFLTYKKVVITTSDQSSLDYHMIKAWNSVLTRSTGLPVYLNNLKEIEEDDENAYYTATEVSYQPYLHQHLVEVVRADAMKTFKLAMECPDLKTKCTRPSTTITTREKSLSTIDETWFPTKLFPSKNYVGIAKAIVSHLKVCKLTSTNSTLGMLIDGEPGLGKTRCGDYIATENILHEVIKIDMMCYLSYSFDKLMDLFYHKRAIHGPTLFLIDEVDKYIDFFIKREWEIEQKINASNKDMVVAPIDEAKFIQNRRCDFLNSLLRVLEKDGLRHPCIVLFCSNNFDTIFQGVDRTHFHSLSSRFMRYTFTRCYKPELVEYFSYYNTIFKNTDLYVDPLVLQTAVSELKEDISITFRSLNHISFRQQYNLLGVIKELNERVADDSPPLTPREDKEKLPITHLIVDATPLATSLVVSSIEDEEKKDAMRVEVRNKEAKLQKERDTFCKQEEDIIKSNTKFDDQLREKIRAKIELEEKARDTIRVHGEANIKEFYSAEPSIEKKAPKMENSDRDRVMSNIKNHLNVVADAKGKKEKTKCVMTMLNYMLSPIVIEFMEEYPAFKATFEEKMAELEADSVEVAKQIRPIRLRFEKAFS